MTRVLCAIGWVSFVSYAAGQTAPPASSEAYDPLAVAESRVETLDTTVDDSQRARKIPIKVYLPNDSAPAPVVLFSHGLGGSREGSGFLGQHWARRGYVCIFVQHPGSDESVWRGVPVRERLAALRDAANAENFQLRVADIPAVIDQLARWNEEQGHRLHQRMDLNRLGMSGHSFGAVTTQAVSGQAVLGRTPYTEARIKAALSLSPSIPAVGQPEAAFEKVAIPWMLMTGTLDDSPIGSQTPESRRQVFPALPPGSKYELVLDQAEHSVFTDARLPNDRRRRNPQHHRSIRALSTAFWDAYLREDAMARSWLDGDEPRKLLDPDDLWQRK